MVHIGIAEVLTIAILSIRRTRRQRLPASKRSFNKERPGYWMGVLDGYDLGSLCTFRVYSKKISLLRNISLELQTFEAVP